MYELKKEEFHKVANLLKEINHNKAVFYSVIEGTSRGKVYVDNIDNPNSVFLYPENSFYYIIGNETNDKFNRKLYSILFEEILEQSSDSELVLFPLSGNWNDKLNNLFKDKGAITIDRNIFSFNQDKFNSNKIRIFDQLPEGYILRRIDKKLAEEINVIKSWSSNEEFLNKGIGYCILNDNEIISACYSIYLGNREAEIDIFTKDEYMGKGFGRIVATAFIEECLDKGIIPSWSCWPFREASRILAIKLGFKEMKNAKAFYWSPNM